MHGIATGGVVFSVQRFFICGRQRFRQSATRPCAFQWRRREQQSDSDIGRIVDVWVGYCVDVGVRVVMWLIMLYRR